MEEQNPDHTADGAAEAVPGKRRDEAQGRGFFGNLRCGVRLFEYPHTLLHQKVITVDGVWCAVGSTNFDDRSFEINDEITLGFKDEATAQAPDAIFDKYARRCSEIKLERWRKRGWGHRLIDNVFYVFNEVL